MSTTIILLTALVAAIVIILLVIARMRVREPVIRDTEADRIAQVRAARRRAREIKVPTVSESVSAPAYHKADLTEDVRIVLNLLETLGYPNLNDVELPDHTIKAGWVIRFKEMEGSYDFDTWTHRSGSKQVTYLLSDGRIGFKNIGLNEFHEEGIIYQTMSPKEVSKLDQETYDRILGGLNSLRHSLWLEKQSRM